MTKTLKTQVRKIQKDATGRFLRGADGKYLIEYAFEAGERVEVVFDNLLMILVHPDGRSIRCRASNYPKYFGGKAPSATTMMKWEYDGYCKTVTGHKTEPDGHGPDGSPSWMLALGMI